MTAESSGVAHLLRDLAPQVLGAVVRRDSDFGGAEDAVQEALIAAAAQWPVEGVPRNPRGWLYQVAMRRLTDYACSEIARRRAPDHERPRTRLPRDARSATGVCERLGPQGRCGG